MSGNAYMLGLVFCCITGPASAGHHHTNAPETATPPPLFDDIGVLHHPNHHQLTAGARAQKKIEEATETGQRFRKAWAKADVKLTASTF